MKNRPYILTIAGLDPSGGAGLLADIKTLEQLQCYGLVVCSTNTIQNDIRMDDCLWTDTNIMRHQIDLLFERFHIDLVKIGVIENWEVLDQITDYLISKNNQIKIVLDPVLKSSSDYVFHESNDTVLESVLRKIYLITPNLPEIQTLCPKLNISQTIAFITSKTNLLLKGGHDLEKVGYDQLYFRSGSSVELTPANTDVTEKHGSGCVLSSAITGYLALGDSLEDACTKGKMYTEKVLGSNQTLLGYHG
ncbi:hydroxymethylpyrimidine/phosphomethylpyrimidine kinase [bacterium SCSIO 12643]|nr:hydroxymethylpyrimidine/phosphomethylpyrimidine kinase [bacterium SCSIO 12643]